MLNDLLIRRLVHVLFAVIFLILFGTAGYTLLEGWSWGDGFFMTVITLSTVGYGEVQELTPTGRGFSSVLIFMCLIGMTCWTAALTSFVVEGDLSGRYTRRRTLRMIEKLKGHVIVCGSDTMAQAVIERLMKQKQQVVLVDNDETQIERLRKRFRRLLVVVGKATNELTLAEANVLSARAVVAAMESEVDNLLVGITCKDIGANIAVYARSNDTTVGNRLRKAGIDEVISPARLCGNHVADMILTELSSAASAPGAGTPVPMPQIS